MGNFNEIINQIATQNKTDVLTVYLEMRAALLEAKNHPDPQKREEFAKIPCKGATPTPEEFIAHMAKKAKGSKEPNRP